MRLRAWNIQWGRGRDKRVDLARTAAVASAKDADVCFDFFFVSENLATKLRRIVVDDMADASDHQPVMLELAI